MPLRVVGMQFALFFGALYPAGRLHRINPAEPSERRFNMVMVFFSPLRRWWQTTFGPGAELAFVATGASFDARGTMPLRRLAARTPLSGRSHTARPLTAFSAPAPAVSRPVTRRFWMTLDPKDLRHAALGGSFAEVCAALEQLAAVEEHRA